MGVDGFPIDIIIFAAIAAFVVLRLRNVLGRRTGDERPPPGPLVGKTRPRKDDGGKVVQLPDKSTKPSAIDLTYERAKPGSALELGLTQIKKADKSFNADDFLKGGCAAFEIILEAFAAGNMEPVKNFISDDVYDNFVRAAKAREEAGERLDTTVIGVNRSDIVEARMEGREALLTTKFVSEQINAVRDKDGNLVDGDPDKVNEVTDIWTFQRDTQSPDPNWVLIETRSSN